MRKAMIATGAGDPAQGVGIANSALKYKDALTPRLRAVILRAARFVDFTAEDEMGLMFRIAVLRAARRAGLRGFRWADAILEKPYRDPDTGEERLGLRVGEAWHDDDLVFCQHDGTPWKPDHVSKRFKRLAALAGVRVITLHEGGRHTGNSLMQDAGVDQELRMREAGYADRSVNDRYTHPLEQAHLAAAEQTATLLRKAREARKAS